jgi:plastocyanin
MTRPLIIFTAFAVFASALGCGGSSSSPSAPSSSADVTINIVGDRTNQSYSPSPTTVRMGQTVAWRNNDTTTHNANQDNGTFSTGNINAGASSSPITMSTAGTFIYHCTLHPGMVGTITVQ